MRLLGPCKSDAGAGGEILTDQPTRLDRRAAGRVEIGGENEIPPARIDIAATHEIGRRGLGQPRHRAVEGQAEELQPLVAAAILGDDERAESGAQETR